MLTCPNYMLTTLEKSTSLTSFELVALFQTCFESDAFGDQDSNLVNDYAFGDSVQVEMSFARFESVLSQSV